MKKKRPEMGLKKKQLLASFKSYPILKTKMIQGRIRCTSYKQNDQIWTKIHHFWQKNNALGNFVRVFWCLVKFEHTFVIF